MGVGNRVVEQKPRPAARRGPGREVHELPTPVGAEELVIGKPLVGGDVQLARDAGVIAGGDEALDERRTGRANSRGSVGHVGEFRGGQ